MLDAASETIRDLVSRLRGRHPDTEDVPPATRRLMPAAMDALGLDRQPFTDDALADALFIDDAIEMQLNMLARQLHEGEMLPLLKGEPGSGKTSLLILLMARSNDAFHFFVARGDEALRAEHIIADMLRLFTRDIPGHPQQCFRQLARQLRGLVADDRPAVLVIDDADRMTDEQLNNVMAMHDSLRPALGERFRVLLAADADIELRLPQLQSEQLQAGRVMAAGIRPLARPRIGPYLEQRLAAAGLVGNAPFDEAMIERIASSGGTLPRDIETAAAAELNAGLP